MQLAISQIRTDGGTQPRLQLDFAIVSEYAESMADGATFPPITVFHDGANYWLADGFHRLSAVVQNGATEIPADVRQGTLQDAQWHSYSVNQSHGLRRTNDDKRRAVEAALQHEYARRYSNVQIARHCGVSEITIRRYRESIFDIVDDTPRIVTRNGTTYEMNVGNIGIRPEPTAPALPFEPDYSDFYGDGEPALWQQPTPPQPLASHQLINASTNNEWYTPRPFLDAAHEVMGGIDLDPASNAMANEAVRAERYYTIHDDGFAQIWGTPDAPVRVWMNPPYGTHEGESNQARWSRRLIEEYRAGNVTEAIMLVNAVTGNGWFAPLKDFPICFPDGRIRFYNADTEAGQPTHGNALVYFGPNVARFVKVFSQFGAVMARLVEYDGHVYIRGVEDGVSV